MSNPRRISKNKKEVQDDTIDIDTFKAWLSGVEDMQGDDWTPCAEQWKKIRSKINLLTVVEYEDPKHFPQQPMYRGPGQIGVIQPPMYQNPPIAVQGPIAYQQGNSSLDAPQQRPNLVERPNLGHQGALPGFQAPGAGNGSTNSLLATDDMSGKPYESTFG